MYDLIVIGGGPGGYLAAERAGSAGLKVVLFEERSLGGVCLNEGCIPSKTLLNSAKVFEHAKDGKVFGVTTKEANIDQVAVIKRKKRIVKILVAGVKQQMKKSGVEVVAEHCDIVGKVDGGFKVKAKDTEYEAKNIIIATGSEAMVPPIPGAKEGIEKGYVMTNREILDLEEIPERLVIVGGGVIGLEMASYYQTVGSNVTVIEMLDHIAGNVDSEIGSLLQKNYEKKGITFKLNAKVTSIAEKSVTYELDGETFEEAADKTLLSIGRRPVTSGFGLENLGVFTERGHIVTDKTGLTNVPGVYAIGDVNGVWLLAHAAYREAEVAVNTILGKSDEMRYDAMPSVIYTNPEVAFVGLTADDMKKQGKEFKEVTTPMSYSGRYMAETDRGDGICKIVVDHNDRLVGCHLLGSYASEFIIAAGAMIEKKLTVDEIKEIIFPHPTVCEIIREAIFQLE